MPRPSYLSELPDDNWFWGEFGQHWERERAQWERVLKRTSLAERQNHRCCYCGERTCAFGPKKRRPTLEHVVRKADGGTDDLDNLAMACADCNERRGDVDAYQYVIPRVRVFRA